MYSHKLDFRPAARYPRNGEDRDIRMDDGQHGVDNHQNLHFYRTEAPIIGIQTQDLVLRHRNRALLRKT